MATKRKPRRVWYCRLSHGEIQALNRIARSSGVKPAELVRAWIVRDAAELEARMVAAEAQAVKAALP